MPSKKATAKTSKKSSSEASPKKTTKAPRKPSAKASSGLADRKAAVIGVLNLARADELSAILQYMAGHYALDDADYSPVASNLRLIAIDEMRHAEAFAERIYEVGGMPVSAPSMPVKRGQELPALLDLVIDLEVKAIDDYNEFLEVCRQNRDSVSAKLFERILEEEQIHLNYFEDIRDHIKNLGAAYLAQIAGGAADGGTQARGFVAAQQGGGQDAGA